MEKKEKKRNNIVRNFHQLCIVANIL